MHHGAAKLYSILSLPYSSGAVDLTPLERASYFHIGKIGWALAVGWVILACELDVAGTLADR